jgi:5'-methylthioadenosine phosphorylase
MLAIVGGTGLYELPGLDILERIAGDTPFGRASGDVLRGCLHDRERCSSRAMARATVCCRTR